MAPQKMQSYYCTHENLPHLFKERDKPRIKMVGKTRSLVCHVRKNLNLDGKENRKIDDSSSDMDISDLDVDYNPTGVDSSSTDQVNQQQNNYWLVILLLLRFQMFLGFKNFWLKLFFEFKLVILILFFFSKIDFWC